MDKYYNIEDESFGKQSDEWSNMPLFVKEDVEWASRMLEVGDFREAVKILEALKREAPEILIIQRLLGAAYVNNGNPEKAIKTFAELVELEPKNANFIGNLGWAYLNRGWYKKAVDTLVQATSLDEENIWLWMGLSDAHMARGHSKKAKKVLQGVLTVDQLKEDFEFSIWFKMFTIDVQNFDIEALKESLKQVCEIASTMGDKKEEFALMLYDIASEMVDMQVFDMAKEVLDKAWELTPLNKPIKKLRQSVSTFCSIENEYLDLELDNDYEDDFVALIMSKLLPVGETNEEVYLCLIEYNFLLDFHNKEKNILMLEKQYPKVYQALKEYFDQVGNKRKRNKMIKESEEFFIKNHQEVEMFIRNQF